MEQHDSNNPAEKHNGPGDTPSTSRLTGESDTQFEERRKLQTQLSLIRHKIIVMSGKGGVGKSTIAVNLAASLLMSGKRVGLLDVDMHGPSIPTMLGLDRQMLRMEEGLIIPIDIGGLKVLSLGLLLQNQDEAVIWRGPMKMGVITQFLRDAAWGDLDFLIIDSPPGTGDEPLSICQLIGKLDGAVIVTTPQKVAAVDVRKSVTFCRRMQMPVLGIVENMSGFVCPKCGEITQILRSGGGKKIAEDMGVPLLGSIPIDPNIAASSDEGLVFINQYAASDTARIMREVVQPIIELESGSAPAQTNTNKENQEVKPMKIAIPLAAGKLSMHFGHCEKFALVDADPEAKKILGREDVDSPPHQPGLLPPWLAEKGANMIIAGGMGQRAQDLFSQNGIAVIVGAPSETPEDLVNAYMAGNLQAGENVCDH